MALAASKGVVTEQRIERLELAPDLGSGGSAASLTGGWPRDLQGVRQIVKCQSVISGGPGMSAEALRWTLVAGRNRG
jgi:hypothetical protein